MNGDTMVDLAGTLLIIVGVILAPFGVWRTYLLVRYKIAGARLWTEFVQAAAQDLGLELFIYDPGHPERFKDFHVLASDDRGVELSLQRSVRGTKHQADFGKSDTAIFTIVLRFASSDDERVQKLNVRIEALLKAFRWRSRRALDKGSLDLVRDPSGVSIVVDPPMYRSESDALLRQLFRQAAEAARDILHPNGLAGVHRHLRILDVWRPQWSSNRRFS